jgi:hypothetical protein
MDPTAARLTTILAQYTAVGARLTAAGGADETEERRTGVASERTGAF